ncbi:hypothetical protein [Actinoplanes sp. NPDC049802]|uniref:hypothetical protein n=1 Tax=Actinoplanes sp. NPDC049802 TaxID=3154742 RepID=UPI0033FC7104
MLIGYSCWGFLGPGITDTPDGGRSHRRVLVDGLRARGNDIVFLQANRDLLEAGDDLTATYQWDAGLPDIDALFLEWRWPIGGRNTTPCDRPGHTCDLHRQQQLLAHYTTAGTPTLLWDKDRRLNEHDPLRRASNVTVCEPALHPSPGATSLLFPIVDAALDSADPAALTAARRDLPLLYIGNQYDRDDAFDRFFAPAARAHTHLIAGKWPHTQGWPGLNFTGRIPFAGTQALYQRSLATIVLLPDRYAAVGHMTQRLFEAVLAGCLPLTPADIRDAARFTPPELHIGDGTQAARLLNILAERAGTPWHADLLAGCLERLNLFRLSRQLDVIAGVLAGHAVVEVR